MDLATSSGTLLLAGAVNLAPGGIIARRYQVERVLGRGAMGPVIAARELTGGAHVVVLKLIQSWHATNPTFVERFLREGGASIELRSEHVRRIHEVGRLDCGTPYLVMEYLEGLDLGTVIRTNGPLGCQAAATYVLQVCDALVDAHAQGLVHGELRPNNVFLTRRADGSDCIKVLDFGIPRMLLPGETVATHRFAATGASPYMAPEQLRSSPDVDARADIWGLGVLLFELLTGRQPFRGGGSGETRKRVFEANWAELRKGGRQVKAIVRRCLEEKPQRRYPSVRELLIALAPLGSAEPAPETDEFPMVVPQLWNGPRARLFLVVAGIALTAGSTFVLGRVSRGVSTPEETPSPSPARPVPMDPAPAPAVSRPVPAPAAPFPAVPPAVEAAEPPLPAAQTSVPARRHFPQVRPARRLFSVMNQAKRVSPKETRKRTLEIPDDRK